MGPHVEEFDVPVRHLITALATQTLAKSAGQPGLFNADASLVYQFWSKSNAIAFYIGAAMTDVQRDPVAAQDAAEKLEKCIESARERATKLAANGATAYEAPRQLEADIASCTDEKVKRQTARFIGTVQADLALSRNNFCWGPWME